MIPSFVKINICLLTTELITEIDDKPEAERTQNALGRYEKKRTDLVPFQRHCTHGARSKY